MKTKIFLPSALVLAVLFVATAIGVGKVSAEETIKDILPSGVAGTIETALSGTPAAELRFFDDLHLNKRLIAAEAKISKADSQRALDAFVNAKGAKHYDGIDNAPEEKERGILAGQTVPEIAKGGDKISLIGFGSFSVAKRNSAGQDMDGDGYGIPEKLTAGSVSYDNITPFQLVGIGEDVVGFEADIHLCANGQSKGFGFVEFSSNEGVELRLVPVAGYRLREERGAVLLVLVPVFDRGGVPPPELTVAIVRPIAGSPNFQSWDLKLGRTSAVFDVEGTIGTRAGGGRCEPADFGQLPIARAQIDAREQLVDGAGRHYRHGVELDDSP